MRRGSTRGPRVLGRYRQPRSRRTPRRVVITLWQLFIALIVTGTGAFCVYYATIGMEHPTRMTEWFFSRSGERYGLVVGALLALFGAFWVAACFRFLLTGRVSVLIEDPLLRDRTDPCPRCGGLWEGDAEIECCRDCLLFRADAEYYRRFRGRRGRS
jgi:hypothetical protein